MRLLVVGVMKPGHMGAYLSSAARLLEFDYQSIDAGLAEARTRIAQSFYWRFCGKRPARLGRFARSVVGACESYRPDVVVTTGRAPLLARHIADMQMLGAKVVNYSTDDPWNVTQKAPWFVATLANYDVVFTPRRANLGQFRDIGVKRLHYLPFAYDPEIHKPWPADKPRDRKSDVLFVGGCDGDRLSLMSDLARAGVSLALFGGYWDRHEVTRPFARGIADQDIIRAASASAGISLCLVRRANRDEHVMRSYEAAAIGGCILAEDTGDHRKLFGDCACYFKTADDLLAQATALLADPDRRAALAGRLCARLKDDRDTYASRLSEIIDVSLQSTPLRVARAPGSALGPRKRVVSSSDPAKAQISA
jgi:spore maturation protein CgeB